MKISPTLFRHAFNRFQAIHMAESGFRFDGFLNRKSFVYDWEAYKSSIPDRAMAVLDAKRWSRGLIGKGDILNRVVEAIEMPGNNLLQWQARQGPSSRAHLGIIKAQKDPKILVELETLFFQLFKRKKYDESTFAGIMKFCGRRYELLAYLFFVAASDNFLPLRTRSFDKAMSELGLDIRTEGQCSWNNYQSFNDAMRAVQAALRAEGILDASLLDAHSFCWVLARHDKFKLSHGRAVDIQMRPFQGTLQEALEKENFVPNDEAKIRDMQQEAWKRQASGEVAEEIALNAERNRLKNAGCTELAAQVALVSNKPGLGYDIDSFEIDGSKRCIEVKNISNSDSFFVTSGEWSNSRSRLNYWFYLVRLATNGKALVEFMPAIDLQQTQLQPVQYIVKIVSKS